MPGVRVHMRLQPLAHGTVTERAHTGAHEVGAGHYPLFVFCTPHGLPRSSSPFRGGPNRTGCACGVVLLQALRVWMIPTLGPYWTTRIITLEDATLVRSGLYRFTRHPNNWMVCAEIGVLPLAFGAGAIALVWSAFNTLLLRHRISVEEAALSARPV